MQSTRDEEERVKRHWTLAEAEEAEEERERKRQQSLSAQTDFRLMDGWKRLWLLSIKRAN